MQQNPKQQHLRTLIQPTNMTQDADTRITVESRKSEAADSENANWRQNQKKQDTPSASQTELRKEGHSPKKPWTKLETRQSPSPPLA